MPGVAVTLGDPAGIGPEVAARAISEGVPADVSIVVVGPRPAFDEAVSRLKLPTAPTVEFQDPLPGVPSKPGQPGPDSGRAAIAAIDASAALALSGRVQAIVTAPVAKRYISESGVPFSGHTERFAALAHVRQPVMMFVGDRLRVALVTTHLALRKVPGAVTLDRVVAVVRETSAGLTRHFGVLEPRLALAGLNPHAGEGGHFGREEIDVLEPAVQLLRGEGVRISGPFAADTLFRRAMEGEFDAVVAMYHDQALGPVKTACPDAVNVTLGLPFVRTSPDHGTAFDLAGTGRADARPMRRALVVALAMSRAPASLFG